MDEFEETQFWHVRFTVPHKEKPKILDLIESWGSNFILAQEISKRGKEHFQAITEIPTEFWPTKVYKKHLDNAGVPNGNGKRMRSKVIVPLPRAIAYLMKDHKYDIKGFNEVIVAEAEKIEKEFKESFDKLSVVERLRIEIKRDLKITKIDNKEVYVFVQKDTYCDTESEYVVDKEFILKRVLEFYKKTKCRYAHNQVISNIQTLCLEFVPSYDYDLYQQILEKI